MFSFFKTKKSSPSSSPESDPIPSANDYVIVNQRQGTSDINPNPNPNLPYPLYPNFGQFFNPGVMPPIPPTRPPLQHTESFQYSYVNDVPFKLSSQLSTGETNEITRIQVDDILASILSKVDITQIDYDFTLERSILQEMESIAAESAKVEENAVAPIAEEEAE